MKPRVIPIAALLLLLLAATTAGATATTNSTTTAEKNEDKGSPVSIDLSGLVEPLEELAEELESFTEDWDERLIDAITYVIYNPFRALAEALIGVLTHVIVSYPQVQPNPDVQEMHRLTFIVSVALSGLAFAATGILYMTGPLFGIQYSQIRMIIPRIILALVFGALAPFLLQYALDFFYALTLAFKPTAPDLLTTAVLTAELGLIAVVDSSLLLGTVVLFLIRDVYIIFATAIAPLIALAWALPYTKRYADTLIGAFWAALLIGPLDMLVIRLTLNLLQADSGELPHWLWGVAMLTLLLIIPHLVFSASQSMIGTGRRLIPSKNQMPSRRQNELNLTPAEKQRVRQNTQRLNKGSNTDRFDYPWRDQ